ncbi:hypothetical protein CLI64_19480 [Nostoc sp. CENA543]|uniref:hypothetical protein n=1 Tax=Nostoc sp. CENA543 TaxID=1869241 RepID=UPI000CA33EA6|nr:hypothetical protein [Nostoc sp. CENA543]AUT02398.1 hypothetical protein CLI64_19480 [Nostoc sp. CENA543]
MNIKVHSIPTASSDNIQQQLRYKQFLLLGQKYPGMRLVPTQEIDAVLHTNMTNTNSKTLFNTLIKHIPEFGMGGAEEYLEWQLIFAQTKALFEQTFGKGSMGDSPPACCEILIHPLV